MKAYVLLIAIRPSDEDVKPGSALGAFRYEYANIGTGFLLQPSSPHIHQLYVTLSN